MNPPRLAEFEIAIVREVFRRHPEGSSVTLFGSRAKGTASGIKGCTNRGYKSARIIDEAMLRAAEPEMVATFTIDGLRACTPLDRGRPGETDGTSWPSACSEQPGGQPPG